MFHILSGSSSTPGKSAVSESLEGNGGIGEEGGVFKYNKQSGSSSTAYYQENDHRTPNKKRSRRRRKGKSRTKVEPVSSYKSGGTNGGSSASASNSNNSKKQHDAPMTKRDIYFALDCEMVGVGVDGMTSAVGRVTIANWENQIVLDTYVQVPTMVTDYRTHVSGITPEHLQPRPGHALMTFAEVREKVQSILRGKILIGHALENDLKALGLYHPWTDIRDTATYSFFMREFRDPVTQCVTLAPKKLRDLAWEKLGRQIQMPGAPHSPVEDAVAALDLYKEVRGQWEDHLIHVAQRKDKEQQQQLMERRRQQQQEQQQRQQQQQQQQMQMRRFQWLASATPPQPLYPTQQQQQHPMLLPPPPMQSPSYRYPPVIQPPPMMMMPVTSPAASAFLQGPATPPPQPPQSMRASSWFGFSRRPKQQPSRIPPAVSHDSVATQATITTVQSSFSQDGYSGFSSPRGVWHVREEDPGDGVPGQLRRMATEASQETILHETILETEAYFPATTVVDTLDDNTSKAGDNAESAMSCTDSTTEVSTTENSLLQVDYEPPRYFTNPDPEPMSSLSWFKLWGSSKNKDRDSSTKGDDSDEELEEVVSDKPRRASESETTSYSLFSKSRLFPRRNSESCMSNMCDKEVDEHSRSLH